MSVARSSSVVTALLLVAVSPNATLAGVEAVPTSTPTPPAVMCTGDVKLCPDGSFVGRVPPACEFAPCPAPSVNHFQCYDVSRGPFDSFTIAVDDDFGPSTVEVRRSRFVCAPVDKNGEDPTAPDDPDHLVSYEIRRATPRFEGVRDVVVEDQFGTLVLDLRRPEGLLVPSAKSLTEPAAPLVSPAVDHYQCYGVRGARRRVSGIAVKDQFGAGTTDVKKPRRLCVPVDKAGEGILDAAARLMCYQIKAGPRVNQTVFLDNQLGPDQLHVRRARELCVPVATPAPASVPTPTPTPACCDPQDEPGAYDNPICFEGHACCPHTGEWACSIGDGVTFVCGGEPTTGPFGDACTP
jgi:hypothetical protein